MLKIIFWTVAKADQIINIVGATLGYSVYFRRSTNPVFDRYGL